MVSKNNILIVSCALFFVLHAHEEYDPFVHTFPMLIRTCQREIQYLQQKQRLWQSRIGNATQENRYPRRDVLEKIDLYKKQIGRTYYKLAYYNLQQAKNKEFSIENRAKLYFDAAHALCLAHDYGRKIPSKVQENIYSFFRKAALFYERKKWYWHALESCQKLQYCLEKGFVLDSPARKKERSLKDYAHALSLDAVRYAMRKSDIEMFSGYLEYALEHRYIDQHGEHAEFVTAARAYLAVQEERDRASRALGALEDLVSVGQVSDLYSIVSDRSDRRELNDAMCAGTKRMRDDIEESIEPKSTRRRK